MKKQIKMLTDIVVAAAVTLMLTVALLPAGAEEPDSEIVQESQSTSEETKDVLTSKTTTEPEKSVQTSETTTSETTTQTHETSTSVQTTTAPPQTTTQTVEASGPSWTEQETSGVMYVNTDGICSVEVAQIGSKKIKQYGLNDAVTVVAVTNTDYYKLEDGTFIHADFLSDSETVITTAEQTEPPAPETEAESETEETDEAVPLSVGTSIQSMALEMYDMVNEYRAQHGLYPLQWDYSSYPAALIRANEILQYNSHTRPDGTQYLNVYSQLGYSPSYTGENIVYYYSTPRSALDALINSPSHRDMILSTKYTHISIAYVYDENSYWGYYWVQEFTTP